jgi:hypothetical protein
MYYIDRLNNGQYPKGRKRLAIRYDFKCAKQPLRSLHCRYYTCEHLRITVQYMVNREKVSYHCVIYLLSLSSNIFTFYVLVNVPLCCCSLLINNRILLFFISIIIIRRNVHIFFIRICKSMESIMLYPTCVCSYVMRYSMHKKDSSTRMAH